MGTTELMTREFWTSDRCHVLANPRDPVAAQQALTIGAWSKHEPKLSGHVLFATSGTMGGRKWAALSREAILTSARMVNDHLSVDQSDHWLLALPHFHVGGMGVLARSYALGCSLSRLSGPWNAIQFHALVEQQHVTLSSLVPTQLFDIVEAGLRAPDSIRALIVGGGRLDDCLYEQALAYGWPLVETYGMTESCSQIATSDVCERSLRLLPGWQTKVTAGGQLCIKGGALLSAYVTCRESVCRMHDPKVDGWFETGDLVNIDANRLLVKGRLGRCVKVLGELVNLDDIEHQILELGEASAVSLYSHGVSVIALEDARKGCKLILCVQQDGEYSALLESYHGICHPAERIDEVLVTEEIPRGPLGKVQYSRLQEWAAGQLGDKDEKK